MFRGQRPEAIDTRWVFRAYAALAGLAGVLLLISGPAWLGAGLPGDSTLIRVFGSLVIAAGCCAAGFAAVDPPDARRRGLFWFAAGHAVFWLALVAQRIVTGASPDTAVHFLWAVVFALFYVWATSEGEQRGAALISLFGAGGARPGEQLRSRYARQIGEAARQEERKRLARDLHDSVKQQIFAIQTAAATAQVRFDQDHAGAREALEQIRASAREAAAEMRAMLDQLQAVPLENAGLIEALKKQSEALGFRTGARVEFRLG
ncbi:MAG: hypothetical protein IT158_05695, partial [Bryobacterales bacterium]|nr:hypothetical protein [Bryobacterales bacterium]